MVIQFDEAKFRQLILYIAEQCKDHPYFGATKLNKILFFSDFIAYEKLGSPITGAEYAALEHGPGPRRLLPIREDMLLDGDILIEHCGSQQRVIALHPLEMEYFSPQEREIVDSVVTALKHQDAESVSDLSHRFLGWQAARTEFLATGQTTIIPYETIHVSNRPLDDSEMAAGRALAEKHGWHFE